MIPEIDRARRVYLDTPPLIYFIEEDPRFLSLVQPVIHSIFSGRKRGMSSYVTLLEVLVKPLRNNRLDLARQYREALQGQPNFTLLPLEERIAAEAARIRAAHRYTTPDAIQLATATVSMADVFVTNDTRLRGFPDIEIVALKDHAELSPSTRV